MPELTAELADQIGQLLVGTNIDPAVWLGEQLMAHDGPEPCTTCCVWVAHDDVVHSGFFGTLCPPCAEDRV